MTAATDTPKTLCLQPLQEILSTPLSVEECSDLTDETIDADLLKEFETAWSTFLRQNPIPYSARCERLQSLQQQLRDLETSKGLVELELSKQLEFFQSSRESLEDVYGKEVKQALDEQLQTQMKQSAYLDAVAMADHLQKQTLPWQHFVDSLDKLSERENDDTETQAGSESSATRNPRAIKPSKRALLLAKTVQKNEDRDNLELLAFKIDHELLKTNTSMIEKEIKRYENMIVSQDLAGKFLTSHNVWSILKTSAATEASSVSGTISTTQQTHSTTSRTTTKKP